MLIEFPKFNIKLLSLLIFPIFRIVDKFTTPLYIKEDNSLFDAFRYFLCHSFAFIFLFIFYQKNKNANIFELTEENPTRYQNLYLFDNNNNPITILKEKNKKKKKIKSLIFLLCLSLNILFCFLYRTFFYGQIEDFEYEKQSMLIFFDIGFYILLSHLILKQKLYKHHYFAMITMGVILLILFILTIKYIVIGKEFIISTIYFCFYSFTFSLFDVMTKKYMNDYYKTPHFIMFMTGMINTILLLIFDTFAYFLNRDISGIFIGFQKNINSPLKVLFFIGTLISEFLWVFGIKLTIYYFTPCHFSLLEYIAEYVTYLKFVVESDEEFYKTTNVIIFTIAYIVNFFCCLVFNEVLILNFWKLDYNTKKRIQERMVKANDPDDESDIIKQILNENAGEE